MRIALLLLVMPLIVILCGLLWFAFVWTLGTGNDDPTIHPPCFTESP